jgi:phospholipase/carboxylesterase
MTDLMYQGLELWPESMQPQQLFILMHGVGGRAADMVLLADRLKDEFPNAAFFLPDGIFPFDGGGSGRQWYSNSGVTEENRAGRVNEAMPVLLALVSYAQNRFNVLQTDTAIAGFSQGANMALQFSVLHDGLVGRVLAFSGRFAALPEKAPELTTLHVLHGEEDSVISVEHAHAAHARLVQLEGDVTLDVVPGAGHEISAVMCERAIHRLKTTIPKRSWNLAMKSAG